MMDGAKFLNCKSLDGGRDRTRTCDLLRVKQFQAATPTMNIQHLPNVLNHLP